MEGYSLMSQSEYARRTKKSRHLINYHVRKGNLDTELISGIPFIKIPNDDPLSQPSPESK